MFTLQHGGYVTSDGRLFALTPHVLTLAGAYLRANQVVAVLQPVLDDIAVAAQEISSLAVLDGDDVVFVARGSPTRIFSGGVDIGYRLPCFCTAVGRAMLGRLGDAELKTKLAAMKRAALTPQTITDPKRLLAAIAADRAPRLFPGRSRGGAAFPFDRGAGPPLRRRHRRRHQYRRACRPHLDGGDGEALPAVAPGRGGWREGEAALNVALSCKALS